MKPDHPATSHWLDQTAHRCADALKLQPQQRNEIRNLLAEAVLEFPDAAVEADLITSMYGVLARERRQSMSPDAWSLWKEAVRIYRRTGGLALGIPGAARDEWQSFGLIWFNRVSGTTLRQPVRLIKKQGRPRDMWVSALQICCDPGQTEGYAVMETVVYRPPRTSPCQIFVPGDELIRLEWRDLPPRAQLEADTFVTPP